MRLGIILSIVLWMAFIAVFWNDAEASEWTQENKKWETAYMATHLIDWGQTLEIARNPKYYETNPILGKTPTRGEVNRYFLITGIGHYLISRYLDDYRLAWQKTTFFIELGVVTRNASIGIKMSL